LVKTTHKILYKCISCGHIFAKVDLTESEIHDLYGHKYFYGEEYVDYIKEEESLKKNYRLRHQELAPYIDAQNASLLEIGCAYGFYIEESQKIYQKVKGIDIAKDAVEYGIHNRGLNLEYVDFLSENFSAEHFDIVTMWDTIEHLQNPKEFTLKIHKHLNPGGIFAFTTGDISAIIPRIRKEKWRMVHPPTHLHYFSPKSVQQLLKDCGFELIKIQHNGVYRTLGNISYNLFVLRRKCPSLHKMVQLLNLDNIGIYLNTFDIMTVLARKKS